MPPKKSKTKTQNQPPVISSPKPVAEVELSYENAYGGFATYYPDDVKAYRTAVRQAQKKSKSKEEEKAKDEEAKKAKEAEAAQKAAEAQKAKEAEEVQKAFFTDGEKDLDAAPNVPLEVEQGSTGRKASGGTVILDVAELAAAEARDADAIAEDEEPVEKETHGTQVVDASMLAQMATEATDDHMDERRKYQAKKAEELGPDDGVTRIVNLSGDEIIADGDWVQEQKHKREMFYESMGMDPNEEVVWEDGEFPRIPCPTNPVGKGFTLGHSKESLDGLEMPLIEDPKRLIQPEHLAVNPAELHLPQTQPAGFGFYGKAWMPRAMMAGVLPTEVAEAQHAMDKQLVEGFDPNNEDDQQAIDALLDREVTEINPEFYNGAHPFWQVSNLDGNEEVHLTNLDAEGTSFFKLPGHRPLVRLDRGGGWERVDVGLDTLIIDRESSKVHLLWRGELRFGGLDEMAEYPRMEIDVQDMTITEFREAVADEEREKRRREKGTQVLDMNALSDEDVEAMADRVEQAGIGMGGIKEDVSVDAREVRGHDGALIDVQDREDVIMSDGRWVADAKDSQLTEEERKQLEMEQDERLAIKEKKKAMMEQREARQEKAAQEEEAEKKAAKKKAKKKKAAAKKGAQKGAEEDSPYDESADVPLTDEPIADADVE